ncbi:hypothetical protein J1N35_021513 [Gossypium stocksii]|uniref:Uncharacterized protein n=1 Tax=Gossypium stocksii TaxID=47602 RepID=A0A9D3VFV3_9ROSI|nr:hypothetical protein J1N35_021513 [Gossypium stocksii]
MGRAIWGSYTEKTEVMLIGLPFDFDAVISSASLSLGPLPFQRLVDALFECENRQLLVVQEVATHANLVKGAPSQAVEGSVRDGHHLSGGRERGFWPCVQCQICSWFGHLTQCYFYRFNRDFDGSTVMDRAPHIGDRLALELSFPSPVSVFSDGPYAPRLQGELVEENG